MSYMLKTNASDKRTVMQNNDMQNTKMYICEKSTKKKKNCSLVANCTKTN